MISGAVRERRSGSSGSSPSAEPFRDGSLPDVSLARDGSVKE